MKTYKVQSTNHLKKINCFSIGGSSRSNLLHCHISWISSSLQQIFIC